MNTGDYGILKSIAIQKEDILLLDRANKNKRTELFLLKFSASLVFVVLMWLSANSFIYLPFTPVPFTMQVLTVLLSGVFLGPYWAFTAQIEYVLLGLCGVPVFAGFKSGIAALVGPTGGYIASFAFAAFITGYFYSVFNAGTGRDNSRIFSGDLITFISCLMGLFIIYLIGSMHLAGYLYLAGNHLITLKFFSDIIKLGTMPFLLIDLAKVLVITAIYKKL